MVLVFVLLIFTVGQLRLPDALSGRDKALAALNAELAELARSLSMEREAKLKAETAAGELSASLATSTDERNALRLTLDQTNATLTQTQAQLEGSESEVARLTSDVNALAELKKQLESEIASRLAQLEENQDKLAVQTELSAKSAAQVELLNRQVAALRQQLSELATSLDLAKAQSKAKDVRIDELGKELNLALANKVNELQRYRSDFFGRLREVLGNRADIQIVGDRFVVPSELLFSSGTDELYGRPGATGSTGADAARSHRRDSERDRLGAAHRRPYRQAADQDRALPVQLGSPPPRAPSPSSSIWWCRVSRPIGWLPMVSASSARWIRRIRPRRIRSTGASRSS